MLKVLKRRVKLWLGMKIAVWGKTSASYLRVILLWKLKDVASKIRNSKASKPYSTKRERRDKIIKQVSDCARARACVCVVFCLSFPSFSFSAASSSSSSSALSSTSSSSSSSSFSSRYSNSDNVNASNKIATRRLVKEKLKQRARARERLFFLSLPLSIFVSRRAYNTTIIMKYWKEK